MAHSSWLKEQGKRIREIRERGARHEVREIRKKESGFRIKDQGARNKERGTTDLKLETGNPNPCLDR
jgi:hypothetical protein